MIFKTFQGYIKAVLGETCIYFFYRIPVNEESSMSHHIPEEDIAKYQNDEILDEQVTKDQKTKVFEELREPQTGIEGNVTY